MYGFLVVIFGFAKQISYDDNCLLKLSWKFV